MEICFSPQNSETNKYTKIIVDQLFENGVKTYSLNEVLKNLTLFKSVKIYHLNWYESLYASTPLKRKIEFQKKMAILNLLKLFKKKIVWTMHNKMPHDGNSAALEKKLIKYLVLNSAKIIVHSNISKELLLPYGQDVAKKICYVPHPDYIDVYKTDDSPNHPQFNTPQLKLVFLGAVKKYKNIELLINAVNAVNNKHNDVHLVIAGKPQNDKYKAEITELAKSGGHNNTLDLNFVDDDKIVSYILACDLLVLPYDLTSSLNSGTVILAFSNKRSVISPEIGTIHDIEDQSSLISYSYDTEQQHLHNLTAAIEKAVEIKKNDGQAFIKWGQKMYDYVAEKYSKALVATGLKNIYLSIEDK